MLWLWNFWISTTNFIIFVFSLIVLFNFIFLPFNIRCWLSFLYLVCKSLTSHFSPVRFHQISLALAHKMVNLVFRMVHQIPPNAMNRPSFWPQSLLQPVLLPCSIALATAAISISIDPRIFLYRIPLFSDGVPFQYPKHLFCCNSYMKHIHPQLNCLIFILICFALKQHNIKQNQLNLLRSSGTQSAYHPILIFFHWKFFCYF